MNPTAYSRTAILVFSALLLASPHSLSAADPFPNTKPLTWQGDLASKMIEHLDRFLLEKTARASKHRESAWQLDTTSPSAYYKSTAAHRKRLAHILGVRDQRVTPPNMELVTSIDRAALLANHSEYRIYEVRWPALRDVHGRGLLLEPRRPALANVVALPDADHTPEMLAGLEEGIPPTSQYARRLAEAGCRVVIPRLISRRVEARKGRAKMTDREFVYRLSFELGRHPIGYELQTILAVVDWFDRDTRHRLPIGAIGWGEGGLLSLHAAALDSRIHTTGVSGYFGDRRVMWREPIDRNVFGYLARFGDAETAALVAPRSLVIESAAGPSFEFAPGQGGAPGKLISPEPIEATAEVERAKSIAKGLGKPEWLERVGTHSSDAVPFWSETSLAKFLMRLSGEQATWNTNILPQRSRILPNRDSLRTIQLHELEQDSAWLLRESRNVRKKYWSKARYESIDAYRQSSQWYRDQLRNEITGALADPLLSPNPRSRQVYDRPKWRGYEVVLDVYPDVFAYGILLWPKDIKPSEKRAVVVCQHGLEGRPRDTIEGDHRAYHDYAAKLADEGYIVFAPQNCYIFGDRFRTLQRKANPLGHTLFALILSHHEQITGWLASLPNVDPDRIAFYGLSYGGKTAVRIPPLLERYCLSICSADFNEWVEKIVSTEHPFSYVWTGEYEIFEFDLGSTFNHAEMATLMAPRPFMVERGHFDGVSVDELVAYEFAKVRHLYAARLKIPDRCRIEWFNGPHTINGKGTFEFLRQHLGKPVKAD